jgi:hypothetical protein
VSRVGGSRHDPLERLFLLEVEYNRRLRSEANGLPDTGGLHTSYALQAGYEPLLRSVGPVAALDIETLTQRLALAGDMRDVLKARDSVLGLLGVRAFGA